MNQTIEQQDRNDRSLRTKRKQNDTEKLEVKKQCIHLEETNLLSLSADEELIDLQNSQLNRMKSSLNEQDKFNQESTNSNQSNFLNQPINSPEFGKNDFNELELPTSSDELAISDEFKNRYLIRIFSIFEILRHFKIQLRLSPFEMKEFIDALSECNSLCTEIHIALLKALNRNDELNHVMIGCSQIKDSISIYFYSIDALSWPELLRMYLKAKSNCAIESDRKEASEILKSIFQTAYPIENDFEIKLKILNYLCDLFLDTNVARERIANIENQTSIVHEDYCRKCHKLGDLLCCDNCTSSWHLSCLEPPLKHVPGKIFIFFLKHLSNLLFLK